MVAEIAIRLRLIGIFPGLAQAPFDLTSPETLHYNCIAWAAGIDAEYWWPGSRHWPIKGKAVTRKSFVKAFGVLGYSECENSDLENDFDKIALYELGGAPTHASRQMDDGRWTSKLGGLQDISHTLEALKGDKYGEPVVFLKRAKNYGQNVAQ